VDVQSIIGKIQDDLSLDPDVEIGPETELLMSGLVDSLGVVSLIAWLEDEIGTVIDPGLVTLENFECPQAIQRITEQVLTGI